MFGAVMGMCFLFYERQESDYLFDHYPMNRSWGIFLERAMLLSVKRKNGKMFLSYFTTKIWEELCKEIACSILNESKLHIIVRDKDRKGGWES